MDPIKSLAAIPLEVTMARTVSASTKPAFICIGAKKAGTTWLYDQLRQHPQVWLPPVKEIYGFSDPSLYNRDAGVLDRRRAEIARLRDSGAFPESDRAFLDTYLGRKESGLDWYIDLFADHDGSRAGDIDPNVYALYLNRLSQIGQAIPSLKLIFILRDPVARGWSHLRMNARNQGVDIAQLPTTQVAEVMKSFGISLFSGYRNSIDELQRQFPPHRILFLPFDEIVQDPANLLHRVWDFLEISSTDIPTSAHAKSNAGVDSPIPEAIRDEIDEFYRPDLCRALETLNIGREGLRL
jgi:hypothetical protein